MDLLEYVWGDIGICVYMNGRIFRKKRNSPSGVIKTLCRSR